MFQLFREMSVPKISAGLLVGIFRYLQIVGVLPFRLIQGEEGNTVCSQNWLKWIGVTNRLVALCGFTHHFVLILLKSQDQVMQVLHATRVFLSIPSSLLIVGYQLFRCPEIMDLVSRFLRLFRQVENLHKSKRRGFGGRRELVLILLKVVSLVYEVTYQWFMDISEYSLGYFIEWWCNTYVVFATNMFLHIYCLVFLFLGVLYSEVNEYARTVLAVQLQDLHPTISRRKRRKVRCQLENCLALYREIYAVNTAFQETFEFSIVLSLTHKILILALFGYRLIIIPVFDSFVLWYLVVKHILDLLLLTLSVQGAVNQFRVIRRLNLEVYAVSDLPEIHYMVSKRGNLEV